MEWLSFVADLVRSLAWPLALVALVLIVRKPLRELLPLIHRLRYRELEFEFGKGVEEVREEVDRELPAETLLASHGDEWFALARLAEVSPRAAVLEAWRRVELAALETASALGVEELRGGTSPTQVIRRLEQAESLDRNVISLLRDLRGLRNTAAHAPEFGMSKESALEYASMAAAVAHHLRSVGHAP